ncbi:unnamed protein product [Rotaria magnacalcarata]|uniref:C2H2-type domain-containing protein n=1 Tax=Rotaria magnacalcarata TaxID=392030 RepID=A0A816RUV9_9BILA|nr:unnamed protein product [Rotaria magnacalcarata]CAF2080194.1 unnamed protein product [Rotaria magnacalcarata]CAF4033546.1 unnamed protein product [Rotaria magnacalcarata]CAF4511281.1 unnamed protein product [Rotaria magnacalcarata]
MKKTDSPCCSTSSNKLKQSEKINSDKLLCSNVAIANRFHPPLISSSNNIHSYFDFLRSFLSPSSFSFWQTYSLLCSSLPLQPKLSTHSHPYTIASNTALLSSTNYFHRSNKSRNLKKYQCDICSRAFSRSNTLVTHKRIHTGEKPFLCDICDRAFRQPGNLTRHKLTHSTVKPYACELCAKAFNRTSNLRTHLLTHSLGLTTNEHNLHINNDKFDSNK